MSPTHEVTMMRKIKHLGKEWWLSEDVDPIREDAVRLSNEIELLRAENSRLQSHHTDLFSAAIALREAQKAYMANRGNNELGRKVAEAAARLDEVLDTSKPPSGVDSPSPHPAEKGSGT